MAKKGQKFKDYPSSIKLEVVSKALDGRGYRSIARDYPDISAYTIKNWVRKAKSNIDVTKDNRGCQGRPKTKNLTLEDYKERYEILKKYQAFLQARRGKK
jgi:transposase-like protein